jgi:hypothetical protein
MPELDAINCNDPDLDIPTLRAVLLHAFEHDFGKFATLTRIWSRRVLEGGYAFERVIALNELTQKASLAVRCKETGRPYCFEPS